MDVNKVLFIGQEIVPYLPESEMSKMALRIAQGMQEKGAEVRTFMPKYGFINERRNQLHEVIRLSGMNLIIDDTDHPLVIKVATLQPTRLQVYFIFNEDYFDQNINKQLEITTSPHDNDERCIFYVRGVLETVKKLRWMPNIIHCSGWITALAPLYIRHYYGDDPSFRDAKIVYALHDEEVAEPLDPRLHDKLGFDGFSPARLAGIKGKQASFEDLTKLAIDNCHAVMQCSPNVKPEILEMVKSSGLPFLPFEEDTPDNPLVERCHKFYQSL